LTFKHHSHDEQPDDDMHHGCCGGHGHDCCGGDEECDDDAPYSVRARQLEILERVLNRLVREGKFASAEEGSRYLETLIAEKGPDGVFSELELTPEEESLLLVAEIGKVESDEEAESLLRRALEIDPHNLDAQVLLVNAESAEQEAKRLRQIVRDAEAHLGSNYFDAKKGQFYTDPETRPYLRARQALMVALGAAKDFDGAIAEAEGLLDLCPLDHLGVRDYLAGYYLASGQSEKALSFMDERYGADDGAVFQYGRLIAHYQLGHQDEALEALDGALEANPYVIPVLLGVLNAEEIAEDMTPGTPGQALYVIGTLYDAMLRNEPAMEWAASQWVERVRAQQQNRGAQPDFE
jgi:tetratricopeptide (TPR) repeat protein